MKNDIRNSSKNRLKVDQIQSQSGYIKAPNKLKIVDGIAKKKQ
jgi:hypothetical protein